MGKLVILKLGEGSFDQGFPVTLQIGEDRCSPSLEITGKLTAAPKIPDCYSRWKNAYCSLGLRSRLEASARQVRNVSKLEDCLTTAQDLRDRLNDWLHCESFRPVREKLLEQLLPNEAVRVIIQTENVWLRRLPWHLWDFCDRYPKAEIALSTPIYQRVEQQIIPKVQVRVLAILGNSTGINTQTDRALLEQLPNAEISFLVEPQRQELTKELWRQPWDILFFAGHSSSQMEGETGQMYLNKTDYLTIEQLKYALRKAVERGLKIAIFNSCDGLGLAWDLADLQIPQIVVMREPVPDRVAQEFLKSFLEAFASGESFYLAVREARERLQGLEDRFPCATWLPVICQNPAEVPLSWSQLQGKPRSEGLPIPREFDLPPQKLAPPKANRRHYRTLLLQSIAVTAFIVGVRYLGWLQPGELQAFDYFLRHRPLERQDSRVLVVTVTEADIQAQNQEQRRGSLSDRSLLRLLEKLEPYQPRVIGLDIYHDFPVDSSYPELAKRMQNSDRFYAVCKISDPEDMDNQPGIAPPPEVPAERLGFSDVLIDRDGILRRHLLALTPDPASPCSTHYALSSQLAFRYLAAENILPKFTPEDHLQLGDVVFKPLETRTGGYQNIDAWGHQVLLNYRAYRSAQDIVPQVTLSQVLNGQINLDVVKDRIVLIGVTAPSGGDYFSTPYSAAGRFYPEMPGVIAQAQMVSQILSAVLDGRPLLWVWSQWVDGFWIWCWSVVGGLLFWSSLAWQRWGLAIAALSILSALCFGILIYGGWIPLIPAALSLILTSATVVIYRLSIK